MSSRTLLTGSLPNVWADHKFTASPDSCCETCKISVMNAKAKSRHSMTPTPEPLEVVICDIIPLVLKVSLTSNTLYKYLFFVDDHYSKFIYAIGMFDTSSATVIKCFEKYIVDMPSRYKQQKKRVYLGSQLISEEFKTWCVDKSIRLTAAAPRHQEQNSIAERAWRTTAEMTRNILVHAHLSPHFYYHAVLYSTRIINILPAKGLVNENNTTTTPYYLIHKKKLRVGHFHVFGCPCVFKRYQPSKDRRVITRRQLLQHGSRGTVLGFPHNQAGYLIYVDRPIANKHIIVSINVVFGDNMNYTLITDQATFQGGRQVRSLGRQITLKEIYQLKV